MRVGIFAKTFAGSDPGTVLKAAADAGYQSVQYNMACSGLSALPDLVTDQAAEAVALAAQANGVAIAAVSATYNMIHPDLNIREAGRTSFAAIAAKARMMGAGLLTVCSGSCDPDDQWRHHPDNGGSEAWSQMLREFGYLITVAEQHDLRIGVEPELGSVVRSSVKAVELIRTMQSERIRIVFDAANLFETATAHERKRIIEDAVEQLGPHIEIAHAKDRTGDGNFAAAGKGVIDFEHYLAALQNAGFAGDLITHGLSAEQAPDVAAFLESCLVWHGAFEL
jgi:sugar phosphate isomerase/epimerase